jgi:isopenicillin N synthase-like dioxygenase
MPNIQEIPTIDLTDLYSPNKTQSAECAQLITDGLHHIGFIAVKTPEVMERREQAYDAFAEVLDSPEEGLMPYCHPEIAYLRGYTPLRAETAAACQRSGPDGSKQPDERSGWLIGPEEFSDPTLRERFPAFHADNVWPDGFPRFREEAENYYELMGNVSRGVLRALEVTFGYPEDHFAELTHDGYASLRPLRYAAVAPEDVQNTIWGCKHTDRDLLTVLPPAVGEGLQVKTRSGAWIKGGAPEGHSLVQVGDVLKYMTAGYLRSAVHQIVVPEGGTDVPRYSAPMFVYPRHDVNIQPDPNIWDFDPDRHPAKLAGDYFAERLRGIDLAAKVDERF